MKILVLSRNGALYSTQSIVKAAKVRGHEVILFDHLHCNIIIEKGKPQLLTGHDLLEDVDAVIPRIGASATAYGAAIIRQLEGMGIFTTVASDALLKARDKLTCMQILAAHGLDVPKTGISAGDTCSPTVYDHISKGRAVVKLLSSTQGLGVILVDSKNQGQSVVEGFHRVGQDVLIQEFIEDAIEIMNYLLKLGNAFFNISLGESGVFLFKEYMTYDIIVKKLNDFEDLTWGDIYVHYI